MHSTASERSEFVPPREKVSLRALALALLAHIVLIAALTWGVHWKREETASFEAELWSSTTQQAAPKAADTTPSPAAETQPAEPQPAEPAPPAPRPVPQPAVPLPAPIKVPLAKPTPAQREADIALEQEKKRKLLKQQKEAELKAEKLREQQEAELLAKQEKELQKKKEKDLKAKQELADKAADKKLEAKKLEAKELEKQKLAAAAASAATEKQKQAAADAAKEKQHQEAVRRIMGMAGAAGDADSKGTAAKSSGPSAGYAGKVKARVLPNVVFTEEITGNPTAEVEVRTTPDGTIMSQRLLKSSGNPAWDDAVIKAIVRTGSLPRDIDGRVPSPMIIQFKPN
jgi:colicin import membrane protein